MNWFKKYSMQGAVLTAIAGVVISVMPYFESYLEQWQTGSIMAVCGVVTALGRMIPQD